VYEQRWNESIGTKDECLIHRRAPRTQAEFFYAHYNRIISSQIDHGARVLEIGCGRATCSAYLALHKGARVLATDYSPCALEIAKKNFSNLGVSAAVRRYSFYDSSVDLGEFDAIVSVGVMEHIEDIAGVMTNLSRHLVPGGLFLSINVPETTSVQDYFAKANRLLLGLSSMLKRRDKPWLDRASFSKTDGVFRSSMSLREFCDGICKLGYDVVVAQHVNPFPTIGPLPRFMESVLVRCYSLFCSVSTVIFRRDTFITREGLGRASFTAFRKCGRE